MRLIQQQLKTAIYAAAMQIGFTYKKNNHHASLSCNISTEGRRRGWLCGGCGGFACIYFHFLIVLYRRPEITFNHIIHNTHRVVHACCIYLYIADAYIFSQTLFRSITIKCIHHPTRQSLHDLLHTRLMSFKAIPIYIISRIS